MNSWFVVNDNGDIIGHDFSEMKAKLLASEKQSEEPSAGWDAFDSNDCEQEFL